MSTVTAPSSWWEHVLEDLRNEIDPESFEAWLEPVRFERFSGETLTLSVPSAFHRNWVARNYEEQIESSYSRISGREVSVRYLIASADEGDALTPGDAVKPPSIQKNWIGPSGIAAVLKR